MPERRAIIRTVRKQDIISEIESARAELLGAIDGLTPEQMRMPGAVGIWSVKDVLAHLAAWESELVTALNQAQNRQRPPLVDIEDLYEWNEEQYHENVRRSLDAVAADFAGVHRVLLTSVQDIDARMLTDNRRFDWMEGEPLWYLIEETAILHEREHAEDILQWREREGL